MQKNTVIVLLIGLLSIGAISELSHNHKILKVTNSAVIIGNGDTTFAVTTSLVTVTGDGGGDEVIATITGGEPGMTLTLLCVDALWTITDTDAHTADTVDLNSAFVAIDDENIVLQYDGTSWYEKSRSKDSETSLMLHGEMHVTGGGAITITTQSMLYSVDTLIAGDVNGFTFAAADTGPISAMTTSGGGTAVNCADNDHGLVTGDVVVIFDVAPETTYNGVRVVTRIDDHNFTIPVAFAGNDAGTWSRGDRLVANTGSAGTYFVNFTSTVVKGAGGSSEFKIQGYINGIPSTEMIVEQELSGTDTKVMPFTGIITIADADEVFLTIMNNDTTDNITPRHANLVLLGI